MRRTILLLTAMAVMLASYAGMAPATPQPDGDRQVVTSNVYLRTQAFEPWGREDNDAAMDRVFGADNWEEEFFETVNTGTGAGGLFSLNVDFIFMDGSDSGANELEAFLNANQTALNNFVEGGGRLIINSAPNEGNGLSYDGVQITYPSYSRNVVANDPAHTIFKSPYTPIATRYSGPFFGHAEVEGNALVQGPGLTPLILRTVDDTANGAGDPNAIVLGEYRSGTGITLLGGMTMPSFHSPNTEAHNLRANIIHYAANVSLDTTKPVLTLPADITKEATGPNGAAVSFTATATDENPASPQVTCSKNSGDTFPLGTTPVNCSATDAAGNKATGSFNVTVQDTTPPEISGMPADIAKTATSSSGATASYQQPTASDLVDGSVPVNCSPASGSTFALGSTTVNCSASDSRNNTSQKSFKVNVTYSWGGVLQPINGGTTLNDYADDTSSFRLGSTVPVKFKLSGESAGITDATAKLVYAKISDSVAGDEADAGTTAASTTGNLFRYDATNDQYVFNWGTKGLDAGTYQLRIDLGDGTTNTVRVSLR